jgi:ribosomal protein S18 acetylase RimI-like enzyme
MLDEKPRRSRGASFFLASRSPAQMPEECVRDERLKELAEEAGFNAWPALKEIFYDGWLIRLAEGQTRRTNSVNVIGEGTYPLDEKIRYCEAIYRAHDLPLYFRIRSDMDPTLDTVLRDHGFNAEAETRTLFMDFATNAPPDAVPGSNVQLSERRPTAAWLNAHAQFSDAAPAGSEGIRRRLLELVALPVAFASAHDANGAIVSVAYGAVHDRLVSLQWVATDPARRRTGLSRATLAALLSWAARTQGARGACLQVVADNWPAIRLYESLGFNRELFRYHYRAR